MINVINIYEKMGKIGKTDFSSFLKFIFFIFFEAFKNFDHPFYDKKSKNNEKTSWVKISIKMRFYAIFNKKQYINYLDNFIINI